MARINFITCMLNSVLGTNMQTRYFISELAAQQCLISQAGKSLGLCDYLLGRLDGTIELHRPHFKCELLLTGQYIESGPQGAAEDN